MIGKNPRQAQSLLITNRRISVREIDRPILAERRFSEIRGELM